MLHHIQEMFLFICPFVFTRWFFWDGGLFYKWAPSMNKSLKMSTEKKKEHISQQQSENKQAVKNTNKAPLQTQRIAEKLQWGWKWTGGWVAHTVVYPQNFEEPKTTKLESEATWYSSERLKYSIQFNLQFKSHFKAAYFVKTYNNAQTTQRSKTIWHITVLWAGRLPGLEQV